MQGAAFMLHCDGNPITFDEAEDLLEQAHSNVVLLEIDVRLVKLAQDCYGIQFKNTYIARIRQNGVYVLNACGRMNEHIAEVFRKFTPVTLCKIGLQWFYKTVKEGLTPNDDDENLVEHIPYNDLDVVDSAGMLMPKPKVRYRQR